MMARFTDISLGQGIQLLNRLNGAGLTADEATSLLRQPKLLHRLVAFIRTELAPTVPEPPLLAPAIDHSGGVSLKDIRVVSLPRDNTWCDIAPTIQARRFGLKGVQLREWVPQPTDALWRRRKSRQVIGTTKPLMLDRQWRQVTGTLLIRRNGLDVLLVKDTTPKEVLHG